MLDIAVGEVVVVVPVGDGGAGDGGLPGLRVVADEPAGHVAAVGPAGDGDAALVHEAELLDGGQPGHHVLARALAPVLDDGALVGVAEVVAAAIIRLKDDVAAGGDALGQRRERLG